MNINDLEQKLRNDFYNKKNNNIDVFEKALRLLVSTLEDTKKRNEGFHSVDIKEASSLYTLGLNDSKYWIWDNYFNLFISGLHGKHTEMLSSLFLLKMAFEGQTKDANNSTDFNIHTLADLYSGSFQGIYHSGANNMFSSSKEIVVVGDGYSFEKNNQVFLLKEYLPDSIYYPSDEVKKDLIKYKEVFF